MNARLHSLPPLGRLSSDRPHVAEECSAAAPMDAGELAESLAELVPELRRRALQLTRDGHRADDLVQDALERALKFRSTFRGGSNLRAWAMRILSNVFISDRRRAGIERRVIDGARRDPNNWAGREATQLTPNLSPPVQRELSSLPERLGRVVELVDLQEHSYREAAHVLNVPVGTVMSRLHRGRGRLARQLGA